MDSNGALSLVAVGVVGLVAAAVAIATLVVAVAFFGTRRRRDPGDVQRDALARLGYAPAGPKQWAQPINRTKVIYHEMPNGGGRWAVQLTRYNTLTLQIEERDRKGGTEAARVPIGHSFPTQVEALDERFVASSDRPAQCMALATNPTVVRCMLAMPFLSMYIRGDELVIADPERRGVAKLLARQPSPTAEQRLAAETEVHQATLALVTVILDALYNKSTGTLFAEHR